MRQGGRCEAEVEGGSEVGNKGEKEEAREGGGRDGRPVRPRPNNSSLTSKRCKSGRHYKGHADGPTTFECAVFLGPD